MKHKTLFLAAIALAFPSSFADEVSYLPVLFSNAESSESLLEPVLFHLEYWQSGDDFDIRGHLETDPLRPYHELRPMIAEMFGGVGESQALDVVRAAHLHNALRAWATMNNGAGVSDRRYSVLAARVRRLAAERIDAADLTAEIAAISLALGLWEDRDVPPGTPDLGEVDSGTAPYAIEALFRIGEIDAAVRLLNERTGDIPTFAAEHLRRTYLAGAAPLVAGWKGARVAPRASAPLADFSLQWPVSAGRVTARYDGGYEFIGPPGFPFQIIEQPGVTVMVHERVSHGLRDLTSEQLELLNGCGWEKWAGHDPAVWISAGEQMLRVIECGKVTYQAQCATAKNGVGGEMDSLKTPLGWHSVAQKIGAGAPWGQVFRSREATREIWKPGDDVSEDLVLTRVLVLQGEEPGINKGGDVDSLARYIYIHGTNDEANIGVPSSHGCIRLLNDDVMEAFDIIQEGAWVLITER
ncbi:MAG: L,D-transpeptidase [Candidatus Hydrogenedentota bacterium]